MGGVDAWRKSVPGPSTPFQDVAGWFRGTSLLFLCKRRDFPSWAGLSSCQRGFGSWGLRDSDASVRCESCASAARPGGWSRIGNTGDPRLETWAARARISAREAGKSAGAPRAWVSELRSLTQSPGRILLAWN